MPFSDNYCDVLLCFAVMNHQEDFKEAIHEMVRVAKKEVIISFFKPFMEDPFVEKEIIFFIPNG